MSVPETDDGGEAILEAFRQLGVDYIISSPGSEWAPLWEALARGRRDKRAGPAYIDVWHETLAVDMAMGYTLVTGRAQAVVLHAGPGLIQGALGIRTARFSEVPMIVVSGESLTYGADARIDPGAQWYRSLSVAGGLERIVEPLVKWATRSGSVSTLYEMIVRAGEMAQRLPKGPVYINTPVEVMVDEWVRPKSLRAIPPAPKTRALQADIDAVARLLQEAREPVIIATELGRDPEGMAALVDLAEMLGAPVVEGATSEYANFPNSHCLHLGYDVAAVTQSADVVLVIKDRAPWYPPPNRPDAKIVIVDDHPFREQMGYQDLQADRYLEGDAALSVRLLTDAIRTAGIDAGVRSDRLVQRARQHDALIAKVRAAETKALDASPIDPVRLCAALREVMPADAVYVDETTIYRSVVKRHLSWDVPQSYFHFGGLGQGLGIALGVKLAMPDRPVVALMGDGAMLYNPIVPCFGTSKNERLPILIVVFNNGGYVQMARSHRDFYPQGAGVALGHPHGVHIDSPDYAELGRPFGFHGARIDDPGALESALQAALAAVRGGTTAILNVLVSA